MTTKNPETPTEKVDETKRDLEELKLDVTSKENSWFLLWGIRKFFDKKIKTSENKDDNTNPFGLVNEMMDEMTITQIQAFKKHEKQIVEKVRQKLGEFKEKWIKDELLFINEISKIYLREYMTLYRTTISKLKTDKWKAALQIYVLNNIWWMLNLEWVETAIRLTDSSFMSRSDKKKFFSYDVNPYFNFHEELIKSIWEIKKDVSPSYYWVRIPVWEDYEIRIDDFSVNWKLQQLNRVKKLYAEKKEKWENG